MHVFIIAEQSPQNKTAEELEFLKHVCLQADERNVATLHRHPQNLRRALG